jgi:6-phosphogluconolactonase (cycloisomerase 2 family)
MSHSPLRSLPPGNAVAYVGSRTTTARNARGKGIEVFTSDADGHWTHRQRVETYENPSYLVADEAGRFLYSVHGDGSSVSSYRIAATGLLLPWGNQSTQGTNPVHLAISPSGRWLVVVNYASGTIAALPLLDNGRLGVVAGVVALSNLPGPHRTQQRGAHPHQVVFDPTGRWLAVPDKGCDAVHTLTLDDATGALALHATLQCAPMSGPRHLVFDADGRFAWCVLELSSQILTMAFDASQGHFMPLTRHSTLPAEYVHENTGSGIALAPDGHAVHVSNRGHGSVVRFAVDPLNGTISMPSWRFTSGLVPRFIAIDPHHDRLLVANEDADSIVCIPPGDGLPVELASTGSPVCIAFSFFHQGPP